MKRPEVEATEVETNFDPYRAFIEDVPDMVRKARDARKYSAYSYRDFLVGGSVFAWTIGTTETAVFSSGNTKTTKNKQKVCAEPKLLQHARKAGYSALIGLVVVGTTNRDEIKGVNKYDAPTLHPCVPCQTDLLGNGLVSDDLIVITAGAEHDIYQVHSLGEILAMYRDENVEEVQRAHQEGFGRKWQSRVQIYDSLSLAEAIIPVEQQRPPALLAKLAIAA